LLAAAGRKEFDILLVDDLSRLSRDSIEAERTIRKLEFQGVRIIAVSDGYDSTSKARKIQRGFKNLMNETFLDDLRERVHRGHEGQARKGYWNGGRPFGYKLKPITNPKQRDAYDNPLQIGTKLQIDAKQAAVIREIFDKYIAGESHRAIAADLNARGVPSAGTTWARKKHRSCGWVQSAIRIIVMNRLYCGEVKWNQTQFVRDPSTERIVRRKRPRSQWVVRQDESLRIISDACSRRLRRAARYAAAPTGD
jgi:site-specific DNA recombinase